MPTLAGLHLVTIDTDLDTEYQEPTLGFLLAQLRPDLDDVLAGQNVVGYFARENLVRWINRAKAETEQKTKCHKLRVSVAVVGGTHTYKAAAIFEAFEVDFDGSDLSFREQVSAAIGLRGWDVTPAGTPKQWMPQTGSSFRVNPTPLLDGAGRVGTIAVNAGGAGYSAGDTLTLVGGNNDAKVKVLTVDGSGAVLTVEVYYTQDADLQPTFYRGTGYSTGTSTTTVSPAGGAGCTINVTAMEPLYVHGYATSAALVLDTDAVTSIPQGLATPAILARAKALALGSKLRLPGAAALVQTFNEEWGGFGVYDKSGAFHLTGWCGAIEKATKGGRP